MSFQLKDFLSAVGPNASLVFAAWIFLSFLEARYGNSMRRYRELANEYRSGSEGARRRSVLAQAQLYRRRCELIMRATQVGVASAMLLLCALLTGGLNVIFTAQQFLPWISAGCATSGLVLVISAAMIVLFENAVVGRALQEEASDLPEPEDPAPVAVERGEEHRRLPA